MSWATPGSNAQALAEAAGRELALRLELEVQARARCPCRWPLPSRRYFEVWQCGRCWLPIERQDAPGAP